MNKGVKHANGNISVTSLAEKRPEMKKNGTGNEEISPQDFSFHSNNFSLQTLSKYLALFTLLNRHNNSHIQHYIDPYDKDDSVHHCFSDISRYPSGVSSLFVILCGVEVLL